MENPSHADEAEFITECKHVVLAGGRLDADRIARLINVSDSALAGLAEAAGEITKKFNGDKVEIEQLNNIKKNACSEDCSFCGQSAFFNTDVETYRLPPAEEIVNAAMDAKTQGADSYCLVAAWREPSGESFETVCRIIQQINDGVGISVECSLGFLTRTQARKLKDLGVKRYNHNLETARSKFAEICTTHTYQDRLDTLKIARNAGLELCTGGIIGLGETRGQRQELIEELMALNPEEVTINILVPVKGTPLELQTSLDEGELVRVFATVRFALPESILKISGGRETATADSGRQLLQSGANGIITEGYLTMSGNRMRDDKKMIQDLGLV